MATSPPWSEAWTREEGGGKLVYDLDTAEAMLKSRRHLYTPREIEEPEPGGLLHSILRGATPAVPVDISGPDVAIATATRRGGYS